MRVAIDERGVPTGAVQTLQTFPGSFIGDFPIARDGTAVMWLFRAVANLWSVDVPASRNFAARPNYGRRSTEHAATALSRRPDRIQSVRNRTACRRLVDKRRRHQSRSAHHRTVVWCLGAQWAPDGKRDIRPGPPQTGGSSFAWLDIATRELSPIAIPAEGVLSPNLSPDGREIAFHVIDEGGVINVWRQPSTADLAIR